VVNVGTLKRSHKGTLHLMLKSLRALILCTVLIVAILKAF
jgi:hypothetical protein